MALGSRLSAPPENTTARLSFPSRAVAGAVTRSRRIAPSFFSHEPPVVLVRFPVGLAEAPASIPTQHGHATRFTAPSASGRAGSRTGLPHCTPLRHGGVDEARDWPRLPGSVGTPRIDGRLSPLLLRHPPPSYRSGPSAGVDRAEPNPFPADDAPNIESSMGHASAGFASGYAASCGQRCGLQTP